MEKREKEKEKKYIGNFRILAAALPIFFFNEKFASAHDTRFATKKFHIHVVTKMKCPATPAAVFFWGGMWVWGDLFQSVVLPEEKGRTVNFVQYSSPEAQNKNLFLGVPRELWRARAPSDPTPAGAQTPTVLGYRGFPTSLSPVSTQGLAPHFMSFRAEATFK